LFTADNLARRYALVALIVVKLRKMPYQEDSSDRAAMLATLAQLRRKP